MLDYWQHHPRQNSSSMPMQPVLKVSYLLQEQLGRARSKQRFRVRPGFKSRIEEDSKLGMVLSQNPDRQVEF